MINIDCFDRVCEVCGAYVYQGYVLDDGTYHYCSKECLYEHVSEEEYLEMYENGEAYYTEWDDEE